MTKYICPSPACAKIWARNGVCSRRCSSVLTSKPKLPPVRWAGLLLKDNYTAAKYVAARNQSKEAPHKTYEGSNRERAIIGTDAKGNSTRYPSIIAAARIVGVNPKSISNCLSGIQKTARQLSWLYADDN